MQIFHLFVQLLFIHVTSALRATAWLMADCTGWYATYTLSATFDNDILTGLRVWNWMKMFCFTDLSTFFTWWSHANIHIAKAGRYVSYTIKFTNCQNFIFKKTQNWRYFIIFIIKPSHPDGLKNQIWVEKPRNGSPAVLPTAYYQSVMPLGSIVLTSNFSGFNISVRHQHQKTQDCYQNFLYNMFPILHTQHCFMKPSVWLIIAPSGCQYPICCIVL